MEEDSITYPLKYYDPKVHKCKKCRKYHQTDKNDSDEADNEQETEEEIPMMEEEGRMPTNRKLFQKYYTQRA